jgi:TRAP-type C4-dicarboxylate transport system permease small subunit
MQQVIKLARLGAVLPMAVSSTALFALMALTFCDVVMRSAFNAPIEAATELTRIAIAIVVFSALPVLSGRGEHITVDLADSIFDRLNIARLRDGLVHVACGVMLYWPAQRVVVLAERARSYGDQTEYLSIPTFYIEYFIAIMTFITALTLVVKGLLHWFAPALLEP